jgi:glycosyltransferase A (GT-A) superfamily protein (DUF2064 family)
LDQFKRFPQRHQRPLHRAFVRSLASNGRTLLIGTDAPSLDAAVLREASNALHKHDAVFVPALDGGYALVGQRRADPRWFSDMSWSHDRVMEQTRERLRAGLAEDLRVPATGFLPSSVMSGELFWSFIRRSLRRQTLRPNRPTGRP